MSEVKVLAGDFATMTPGHASGGVLLLAAPGAWLAGERYNVADAVTLELADERSVQKVGGAVGWGAAGLAVAGPVGLLAGVLLGGGKKEKVVFVAQFADGKRVMAETTKKAWLQMQAARFAKKV